MNIHTHPIEPQQHVTLTMTDTIYTADSFSISVFEDENLVRRSEGEHTPSEPEPTKIERRVEYRFEDWSGQEDVLELCDMYITELQAILNEWDQVAPESPYADK